MYTIPPKKMIVINILNILKKYTDMEHRLTQAEIVELLKKEYNMDVDRKSVKRNLMNLIDFGYEIEYNEIPRKNGSEENAILTDFYLNREFSDSELRLLIDSVLFSKHIPYSQCKELVKKLEGLSNKYFNSRVKYIKTLPENAPANKQLFYTIDILDEAISQNKQVSFKYNGYGTDKKLHPRRNSEGKERIYIMNPYQMAASNGRYYLICNYDKYDSLSNYRIDRITDIQILETPRKPLNKVEGLKNGLDLGKHMAEHIYMFSGESIRVTLQAPKWIINDLIDWFGKEIEFTDENNNLIKAIVHVNENAMRKWALQYAHCVRVLTPEKLANDIKNDIAQAMNNYS